MMKHICPVCGYDGLDEPAYDEDGGGSLLYCLSCGFQFGFHDNGYGVEESTTHDCHDTWRSKWIQDGMKWSFDYPYTPPPPNWNPKEQLKNIRIYLP